jgi:hypothetical protein
MALDNRENDDWATTLAEGDFERERALVSARYASLQYAVARQSRVRESGLFQHDAKRALLHCKISDT